MPAIDAWVITTEDFESLYESANPPIDISKIDMAKFEENFKKLDAKFDEVYPKICLPDKFIVKEAKATTSTEIGKYVFELLSLLQHDVVKDTQSDVQLLKAMLSSV